jgi:thioredoxin 1
MLGPIMEDLSQKYSNLRFLKVNVDEAQELAMKHQIRAVPTVMLFVNGVEKKTFTGLRAKRDYEAAFSEYSGVSE